VNRSKLNRYVNGKIQRIPDEVIEKRAELLTIEELSDIIHGLRTVVVDPTIALSVIIKAVRDKGLRNFFINLIWQYLGDYMKSASNKHYAMALKLFIKEIIKSKNSRVAKELYDSFKLPKRKFNYKPPPLSLDTLKKIFKNIDDLRAKALLLILADTGLRVGEVLSLKIDQIDIEHRIIKIMKRE